MARIEHTIKNGTAAIFKYIVKTILQFLIRTMIIYKLGVQYVGLDSLYANIISILSLAELGIGSAITFSMYKPVAEHDIEKLKSLNSLYKKVYAVIACFVMIFGIIISPFIKFLVNGDTNIEVNLYFIYFIFLTNTVISYFGAHKKSLLFANQRNDIENNISTSVLVSSSIIQIIILTFLTNYYLYAITIPFFTLIEVIVTVKYTNKMYPEIHGKAQPLDKETKSIIVKNIVGTSFHQIGSVFVMSTDNLLISSFFGLEILGVVSNYILIYNAINSLILIIINALQASVGNLIAIENKEHVFKMYMTINWFFSCIIGFCSIALVCLYQPFMLIWVGKENLISMEIVILIVIKFYITKMRNVTNMFKNCAGLMWNDRFKPIIETIINIIVSIILIKIIGLSGVFIGTIVSTVLVPFWVEPYVLYKNYFNFKVNNYFIRYLIYTVITLISGIICFYLCSLLPLYSFYWFIIRGLICVGIITVVYLVFFSKTNEFYYLNNIIIKPFLKKIKHKN